MRQFKYISEDFKRKYPEVAWSKIAGLRDVLIHQYFGVNLKRIWKVVKFDLPLLKQEVAEMMDRLDDRKEV